MWEKIVTKLLSGKFWLTMMAGYVFIHCARNNKLAEAALASILTAVFMSYFRKEKEEK